MKRLEIIKYEIINYLTSEGINFELHSSKEHFKMDISYESSISYDENGNLKLQFSTKRSFKIVIEFEENFTDTAELITFLKYFIFCKDVFFDKEAFIILFLKYNLGIDSYYIRRESNSGIKYVQVVLNTYDYIQLTLLQDTIEVRNFGEASKVEYGFYTVDPILVTNKLEDVFVYLKENYESTQASITDIAKNEIHRNNKG